MSNLNSKLQTPNSKPRAPNSKLKICILGTRGFPNVQGGVEKHCEQLYPRLVKEGCEVIVLARKPYVGENVFEYRGIKIVPLSCPKNKFLEAFLHTFYGIFVAKKMGCDILHIHAIGPSLFVPLARLLGLKVVMTHHGPDYERKKWNEFAKFILKLGEFLGVKFANKVIAVSNTIAEDIKKKYRKEVVVIPNGVEVKLGAGSWELGVGSWELGGDGKGILQKYGLEKGKYVLAVGRFVPEKGFCDLVRSWELVVGSGKLQTQNFKLVIVGDADHPDKYSKELRIRSREVKNVVLTGILTGKPLQELYSNARLFVLPSYYEGLPIVLLEAASFGLSCIASDIPANREIGLNEDRFFKPGDIQGLAKKIEEFINRPLREEEKARQISKISQNYNWEEIAKRTLEVYREALG